MGGGGLHWKREGEARGCEISFEEGGVDVRVCACVDAEEGEG